MASGDNSHEDDQIHFLKNQLSIIIGYADLMLEELSDDDRRRNDLGEIRRAAHAAIGQLPDLARRLSAGSRR